MSNTVEMRPAFAWTCDNCCSEQFERAVVVEMSAEDCQQMKEEHGIDDAVTGDFLKCPDRVTCKGCGAEFDTKDFNDA